MKNKKYIGIVGGNFGLTLEIAKKVLEQDNNVVVVSSNKLPPDIFVNGIGYYRKETPISNRLGKISSMINMLCEGSYKRSIPQGINIIEEFGKIELKQSKLSKWERERVKSIFLNNFTKQE